MQKFILEERGYFWWNNDLLPDGYLIPGNAVAGSLKIDENGSVELDLDGLLDSARPMSALIGIDKPVPDGKIIRGFLKGTNESVFLLEPYNRGSQLKFPGISNEKYGSIYCLVGRQPLAPLSEGTASFRSFNIELKGFEEWFRLGNIRVNRDDSKVVIVYEKPQDIHYQVDGGSMSIRHHLYGPMPGLQRADEVSLRESVSLSVELDTALVLRDLRDLYGHVCDLLILLTDSEYRLDWPTVSVGSAGARYRLYFQQVPNSASAPTWYKCPTNFPLIREQFGTLFSSWRRKRKEFGPGFYLYLGTRRGDGLYVEHRYVNLIWGLESLHRRKPPTRVQDKLLEKIQRILDSVSEGDRRWLERQLENAGEPTLAERIFDLLHTLPIGLHEKKLREFANDCARLRNDISHFGGMRTDGDYSAFARDLHIKSDALSYLYHLLLLQEIGVDGKHLSDWTHKSHCSYRNRGKLVAVGLLEPIDAGQH